MPTTPSSPLLRLPSELRNKIYTYTLGGHLFGRPRRRGEPLDQNIISLLLVCRQIYNEARGFLFGYNTFLIRCSNCKPSPSGYSFMSLSKEQKGLIHSVRLNMADFELWRLSRSAGDKGDVTAAEESEAEALRIDKRAHLDFLLEVSGSVRRVEVAVVDYLCSEEWREKMTRSREWMEREIYRRVEGVEVRIVWVASEVAYRCVHS